MQAVIFICAFSAVIEGIFRRVTQMYSMFQVMVRDRSLDMTFAGYGTLKMEFVCQKSAGFGSFRITMYTVIPVY